MRPVNPTQPGGHHTTRRPRGYGHDDPTNLLWNRFRTAVRDLLADQPSTGTVRACARRMDQYVIAAAEAETTARTQAEKSVDAA